MFTYPRVYYCQRCGHREDCHEQVSTASEPYLAPCAARTKRGTRCRCPGYVPERLKIRHKILGKEAITGRSSDRLAQAFMAGLFEAFTRQVEKEHHKEETL